MFYVLMTRSTFTVLMTRSIFGVLMARSTFGVLITRSTWIRTLATLRGLVTFPFDSCLFLLGSWTVQFNTEWEQQDLDGETDEKAGLFNSSRSGNSSTRMAEPLSDTTPLPGTNLVKTPLSCTMNLSLACPPYALEMCTMSPLAAM